MRGRRELRIVDRRLKGSEAIMRETTGAYRQVKQALGIDASGVVPGSLTIQRTAPVRNIPTGVGKTATFWVAGQLLLQDVVLSKNSFMRFVPFFGNEIQSGVLGLFSVGFAVGSDRKTLAGAIGGDGEHSKLGRVSSDVSDGFFAGFYVDASNKHVGFRFDKPSFEMPAYAVGGVVADNDGH